MASEASYVICDRFWPSTVAYTVATACRDGSLVCIPSSDSYLYQWPVDMPKPKRIWIFLLEVDEQTRLRRVQNRGSLTSEEEALVKMNFREMVSTAYKRIEGIICVDATKSTSDLVEFILQHIMAK